MLAIILSAVIYLPPLPPLPDGPLPWRILTMPAVPTTSAPTITLPELEHSETFESQQTAIEGQFDSWTNPITDINGALDLWIGDDGALPDASAGDFTVGLAPIDDVGTAYELASWLGAQLAVLFQYIRTAASIPAPQVSVLLGLSMACATLILLIKMFDFAMSIFDAIWTFATTIIQLLGEYVPTGG